jgi:hypothetical protein
MGLQYRKDICNDCDNERLIVKRLPGRKLCQKCNQTRLNARKEAPESNTTTKPKKNGTEPTGEKVLFETIWNTRKHVSFLDGKSLGDCAYAWNFAHVLRKAKGFYPKFKLYDKNIILLTKRQHQLYDENVRNPSFLIEKDERWAKVFELREELKSEYNNQ